MTKTRTFTSTAASLIALAAVISTEAHAAEGGAGFYLLGSKGPAAGITPPPGVFISNDVYFYSGDLGGNKALPSGGRLAVGVEGKAVIDVPTVLWVLPEDVAGGHLGLTGTIPFGWKQTSADVTLSGPRGGSASGNITDPVFTVGDPVVGGLLGWEAGNFHWQTGVLVNVPIGDYQKGEISNIAFHHWGADVSGAVTWLDPSIGLDLSAAVGMTFNAINHATDYRTGNEFHFEWAAVQHFNTQFDAGLVGYYYDQLTGDSGSGASSGFKGRVAAAHIGGTQGGRAAARIKYFHEFSVENRARGDAVFLSLSVPLSITKPVNIAAQ
ncbi:MAG: transporter [Acidobacteriaceae bacterium]|nr:transporter [Acidobacteriaceae bacterium]